MAFLARLLFRANGMSCIHTCTRLILYSKFCEDDLRWHHAVVLLIADRGEKMIDDRFVVEKDMRLFGDFSCRLTQAF